MDLNKQVRPALFVVRTRLHKKYFVFCCCDGEAERGDMPSLNVEEALVEVFSYFTYVNVVIPQCTNTPSQLLRSKVYLYSIIITKMC